MRLLLSVKCVLYLNRAGPQCGGDEVARAHAVSRGWTVLPVCLQFLTARYHSNQVSDSWRSPVCLGRDHRVHLFYNHIPVTNQYELDTDGHHIRSVLGLPDAGLRMTMMMGTERTAQGTNDSK